MKKPVRCCCISMAIFCLAGIYTSVFAQSAPALRFLQLPGSSNFDDIVTLLPDRHGFLWFGCNQGLVRFNGSNYQLFSQASGDKKLAATSITHLFEDGNGNIWISAGENGVYVYDYQRYSFAPVPLQAYAVKQVNAITSAGSLLVLSSVQKILLFNQQRQFVKQVSVPDSLLRKKMAIGKALPVANDSSSLWILSNLGLYRCHLGTGVFTYCHGHGYSVDEYGAPIVPLVNTANGGALSASKNKGMVVYPYPGGLPAFFPITRSTSAAYSSNNIDAVERLNKQWLLVATQDSGVALFNEGTHRYQYLSQQHFPGSNLYHLQAKALAVQHGYVAMATQNNGIWIHQQSSNVFQTVLLPSNHNAVAGTLYTRSLLPLPAEGKIFAGSFYGDGLYVHQTADGSIRSFPFIENNRQQTLIINAIYKDQAGIIWLATHQNGLLLFNERKQRLEKAAVQYPSLTQIGAKKIYCFYEDAQRRLYIATGDSGLYRLSASRQVDAHFKHRPTDTSSIQTNELFAEKLVADQTGRLWISTRLGVTVMNTQNEKFHHFVKTPGRYNSLPEAFWYAMAVDKQGLLWMGSSQGLYELNPALTAFKPLAVFTDKNGLQHNSISSMVFDRKDRLWLTCRTSLTCFSTSDSSFAHFTYKNGVPAKTLMAPIQLADNGVVYHGAVEKFFSFHPDEVLNVQSPPVVWLNGFKLFDKDSISGLRLNQLAELRLNSGQNYFSFSFVSPSLIYPDAMQYSWQLVGFDDGWKTGDGRNYTTYTNVPPGEYLFKVRAAFGGSAWSTHEKSISVIITPPFWKTIWFRGGLLLFTLMLAWLFIKRREMLAAKREAEKTEMEKLKTQAYKHQLEIEQVTQYFTTSLYSQQSLDDMLWDIAKNCISRLDFEDCVIYLLDEKRNRLVQKAAWGPKTTDENKIVNPIEIEPGNGIVGTVLQTGVAEIVNDTTKDARYIVDDAMRLSEITVPVIKDNQVIGIIDSEHSQKNFYTERHLQILNTIAFLLAERIGKMEVARLAREKEVELLQLSKDLSEWQITALRAQMNPHFIFNAMNSIQQFTLTGDTDNANRYITKFSTLLRKVLYSSSQTQITLEEEMEQLELYLSLEKLRMGSDFNYTVLADEEIETDALRMPGMLVQPFVENAVKHGLPLRDGTKLLSVYFEMPNEFSVQVTVTDNGIGRKKAAELKQAQTLMPHDSKGMLLVEQRLQLLEQKTGHQSSFDIIDLSNDAGTKVILQIPLQ